MEIKQGETLGKVPQEFQGHGADPQVRIHPAHPIPHGRRRRLNTLGLMDPPQLPAPEWVAGNQQILNSHFSQAGINPSFSVFPDNLSDTENSFVKLHRDKKAALGISRLPGAEFIQIPFAGSSFSASQKDGEALEGSYK